MTGQLEIESEREQVTKAEKGRLVDHKWTDD